MADPLAEKLVQPAVNARHLAYCPTMDLIALASVDQCIHVYRLNGQKVFSITNKKFANKVNQIKWKPNGQSNISLLCAPSYTNYVVLSFPKVNHLLLSMIIAPFL